MSIFENLFSLPKNRLKPVVLVILDGFGLAPPSSGNAISIAKTPNLDKYMTNYPHCELIASGESVGLPANEEGNSEVGHLTLGAGRVILQSLKRINSAIADASFFDNKAFISAIAYAKSRASTLHLMGLVSSGEVHSSVDHLFALLDLCKRYKLDKVKLHLFTDGRDAPPQEAKSILDNIEKYAFDLGVGKIATICGRYYAMDRDRRWDRTEKAYRAIAEGKGLVAQTAVEAVENAYKRGETDEFIQPTLLIRDSEPMGVIADNDAVIFFNFRIDRPRQLTMALTMPDFEVLKAVKLGYAIDQGKKEMEEYSGVTFKRAVWPKNLFFVTMTEYLATLPVSDIAFPPKTVGVTLSEILSQAQVRQLHLAESEKERMIGYYFDGLKEAPFALEEIKIIPSAKVATYDKKPEMSAWKITRELKRSVRKGIYSFIVVNFANPDMVGHSGNLAQTVKAIEIIDDIIGEIVREVAGKRAGTVLLTADHGNAEELISFPSSSFFFTTASGNVNTEHSNNPVPIIIVNEFSKGKTLPKGSLSDVAPTILGLLGLKIPSVMTGQNLLK